MAPGPAIFMPPPLSASAFFSSDFWNFFGSAVAQSAAQDEMLTSSFTPVACTQRLEPSAVAPTFTSRFATTFRVAA